MKIVTRGALFRLALFAALAGAGSWWFLIRMPGQRFEGAPGAAEAALVAELKRDVRALVERNLFEPRGLEAAERWIEAELRAVGYSPERQEFLVDTMPCRNIEAMVPGGNAVVIVGAHYDSVLGWPGAGG